MPASELGKVEVLLVTPPCPKQTLTGKKHKGSVSRLSTAWIDRLPDHTQGGSELVGPKLIVLLQHLSILTYKEPPMGVTIRKRCVDSRPWGMNLRPVTCGHSTKDLLSTKSGVPQYLFERSWLQRVGIHNTLHPMAYLLVA
eukprot:scaffold48695_cov53-Attheya_sp.AAC.3